MTVNKSFSFHLIVAPFSTIVVVLLVLFKCLLDCVVSLYCFLSKISLKADGEKDLSTV